MQIIGGVVSYEDGVKKTEGDQFSPTKKVKVELNFSLDLGEGVDQIQAVLDTAQALALTKLGLKVPTASAKAAISSGGETATVKPEGAKTPTRGPGRPAKTKEDLAKEAGVAGANQETEKPKAPDPAAIVDEDEDPFAVPATTAAVVDEVKPISDADINSAIGKVNAKLQKPAAIRDLIAAYKPEGWTKQFTMRDIPQASRVDFLTKLEALK